MAAAVAHQPKLSVSISKPFQMVSRTKSSSHPQPGPASTSTSTSGPSSSTSPAIPRPQPTSAEPAIAQDSQPKTFKRIRTSLEQSVRAATRSRAKAPLPGGVDELGGTGAVTVRQGKGKEREGESSMLRRLESKVGPFRRPRKESVTAASTPVPAPLAVAQDIGPRPPSPSLGRSAFQPPSLSRATMSSPSLLSPSFPPVRPPSTPQNISKHSSRQNAHPVLTPSPSSRRRIVPLHHASQSSTSLAYSPPASPTPDTPTRPSRHSTELPIAAHISTPRTPSRRRTSTASPVPRHANDSPPPPQSPNRARSPTTPRHVISPPAISTLRSVSATHLPLHHHQQGPSPPSPTPRRSGESSARRRSIDSPSPVQRINSPINPRRASASHIRHLDASSSSATTTSLASPSNPEHREAIRTASSALCHEMLRPTQISPNARESEEIEARMRALARLERVWGKSGSSTILGSTVQPGPTASSAGEERERRAFAEALRDGYVLCQLMNKLRPGSIARVDAREDGRVRTSNVTKFLASCSANGLPSEDLFRRDDLIESTPESLARVASTIVALIRWAEAPAPPASRMLRRGAHLKPIITDHKPTFPYSGSISRAASSTPNLSSSSPLRSSPVRRRWNSPSPLPTVRSDSPEGSATSGGRTEQGRETPTGISERPEVDDTPPTVPPRNPLRSHRSAADSIRASVGDSVRVSMVDSVAGAQSIMSSSFVSETTVSSTFDIQRTDSSNLRFGTVRTTTTEDTSLASSEWPSLSRTEASCLAASIGDANVKRSRRPSETAPVDLSRVLEETEDSATARAKNNQKEKDKERERERERVDRINLGKGKWPDDFIDVLQPPSTRTSPIHIKRPVRENDDFDIAAPRRHSPLSSSPLASPLSASSPSSPARSPPRKIAIVGVGARGNDISDPLPSFAPRRPTHRARHSVDTPGLLPKETVFLRRDSSPDASMAVPTRVMIRRTSSRQTSGGALLPRRDSPDNRSGSGSGDGNETRGSSDSLVPFPRAVSGEHPSQGAYPAGESQRRTPSEERRLQPRGRFQSEVDGASTRRRPRPNSYDELGSKPNPRRSRFESMVNLGVGVGGSANASASDLLSINSDGSAVRQTLIVREEGKAPTHFQLGNCIGRGQFGSVYRALNLNTGQMVAVKRIGLEGLKEEEVTQLMREVDLVKSLSHPSIVKYEGMARDENTLSIVLEYAENGSLGQTLKAFGKLNERLVASYVVKILEGLDYLHQSDVVHCDLKAANILTTKNGNVKLSDFGVSLNLRAMERELNNNVAGTPNWMAPEVIELKGASTKSDIWSLGCTVIELLTGRPPYGDIANSMTVMFRIVEDAMPPLPEGCSEPLLDFLKRCFHKDPSRRPSAEVLFEHEWLKKHWGLNKDLRPQDSIPFLRRVSADLHKNDAVRHLASLGERDDEAVEFPPQPPLRSQSVEQLNTPTSPVTPISPEFVTDNDLLSMREHTFVKTSFGKPVICRVCMQHVKKGAVLCSQCSLISHSRCAGAAPPTCDLRSQLLLYAQFAERGASPAMEFLPKIRGPASSIATSDAGGPNSSRNSLDLPGSQPTPVTQGSGVHPPTAYRNKVFRRQSRQSLTPEPQARSPSAASLVTNNSVAQSPKAEPPAQGLRRKLSAILTAGVTRAPRERPLSISSNSTERNTASMRSRATTTSGHRSMAGGRMEVSISEADTENANRPSMISFNSGASVMQEQEDEENEAERIPGGMPTGPPVATTMRRLRRTTRAKSDGNCVVQ